MVYQTGKGQAVARVVVLGTGGTIASRSSGESGASVATAQAAELVARLSVGHETVPHEIETRDVLLVGSYRLTLANLRTIVEAAGRAAREPGVAGVVVTHGTDTMEETAYLASLCIDTAVPIVFTGAQFAPDSLSSDGDRNLSDAIAFAGASSALSYGTHAPVGIAFGGALWSARGTRKAHSTDPQPFAGGTLLARRGNDKVAILATTRPEPAVIPLDVRFDAVTVDAVASYPGADTVLFDTAVDRCDAVVLVGTGTGNAMPGFAGSVARATARGVPVVLASRVTDGEIVPIYGNGGGVDLVAAGAIPAGVLRPSQARVLAAALVASANEVGSANEGGSANESGTARSNAERVGEFRARFTAHAS